jgi:transposase
MRVKTILNWCHPIKGFVYGKARMEKEGKEMVIRVEVRPRKNGRPICSGCGRPGPGYGRLPERRFEFIPMWGFPVFLVYAMRRIDCRHCGRVLVEDVPWVNGKHRHCEVYLWFLANWAKALSWKEVAIRFGTSWDTVRRAVDAAVEWGLQHRDLTGVTAIGVDEVARRKGHRYLTLVYQINEGCKRLLWIGWERKEETLRGFFDWLGTDRTAELEFIVSDMWKPYLKVIAERAGHVLHILDRFHIMQHFGKAIDKVRAEEARQMKRDGYEPVLKRSRWLLLKRPENLSEKQEARLSDLVQYNLKSVRAYLLKEDFQGFWTYVSPYWAGEFLDRWCTRAMRSRIEPMKKVARMLRQHRPLILNWFTARKQLSGSLIEGFNAKVKLTTKRSYGFRGEKCLQNALYHTLGKLPEPDTPHRFC